MKTYEYEITRHEADQFRQVAFFCSETGECTLNDVPEDQIKRMADLLNERGKIGWELVQVSFGQEGIMVFWKRESGDFKA